jgi:hypothetical protein
LFHNESLAVLLNLPPFWSETFAKLQLSIVAKMKERDNYSSTLTVEAKCAMEKLILQHVNRPMVEM